MKDSQNVLRSDWISVSGVLKKFYEEFPTEEAAEKKANGNPFEKERLIKEWAEAGVYSTNTGSRTHYILEKKCVEQFSLNKDVRQPIYDCDVEQMIRSDNMVIGGEKYLKLMKERNGVLIDTEIVLGHPELGYTGQPDKLWLMHNRDKSAYGLVITDWKTNKPKNFEITKWTKKMYKPFGNCPNNALGHYYVQLPLYLKLFKKMLEGSKYADIPIFGGVVVLLMEDKTFKEYKVPHEVIKTVLNMNMKEYLTM
jgi:hypothetical protein